MDLFKYLDPTTLHDSSFLSFSSFADLTSSPYDQGLAQFPEPSTAGHGSGKLPSYPTLSPTPPRSYSESGSESPENPFSIIHSAFSPSTPSYSGGDFGIFHTPSTAGSSKLSGPTPTVNPSQHVSHRSTSSSDWNSPVTPSLTYKSSVDSLATLAPEHEFYLPPSSSHSAYGWDDQSLGSSSSLTPLKHSPPSPSPYRIASNPSLGAYRHPRAIKQITSMPALKEEEQSAPAFNMSDYVNDGTEATNDLGELTGEFDWAFHDLTGSNSIFQAFENNDTERDPLLDFDNGNGGPSNAASSSSSGFQSVPQGEAPSLVPDLSFSSVDNEQFDPSTFNSTFNWGNDDSNFQSAPSTSYGGQASSSSSVDPMAVFQSDPRPATAPDGLGMWNDQSLLGVPGPGSMLRSVSSDAVLHSRNDNSRSMFAYNASDMAGPSGSQPIYAHAPSQAFQSYASGMPSQNFMARRNMPQNLSINVPHAYYQQRHAHPDHMTLTPLSAPYMGHFGYTSVKPTAPPMKRIGSQPISGSKAGRRFSGDGYNDYQDENVPARKVTKEEASVMQPVEPPAHTLRRESMPMVWAQQMPMSMHGGHSYHPHHQPTHSSVLTTAPLVNIHAPMHQHRTQPLGYYSAPPQSLPQPQNLGQPQKIHPSPHPGSSSASASNDAGPSKRPIARLPSAASKRPREGTPTHGTPLRTPKTRASPNTRRNRSNPSGGTFNWGDTTFINFTPDDGEKLLTGVAPSGSQSKRKREEEQAHAGLLAVAAALSRPGSSDGGASDNGDDNRSKRSRSGGD